MSDRSINTDSIGTLAAPGRPGQQGRWWIGTLNNPTISLMEIFRLLRADYLKGQLERGAASQHDHYQFVVWFKTAKRFSYVKRLVKDAHWEKVRAPEWACKYVCKEETRIRPPEEYGQKPMHRNSKKDWDLIFEAAQQGKFKEIPSDIKVRHWSSLQKIAKDHLSQRDFACPRGIWIYGKPGVGKSWFARNRLGASVYPKALNKWWCGYANQEVVVLDDVDKSHAAWIGSFLKIWGDQYSFIAEAKGTAYAPNYALFVVTSNYTIGELFPDDEPLKLAIERRFRCIEMLGMDAFIDQGMPCNRLMTEMGIQFLKNAVLERLQDNVAAAREEIPERFVIISDSDDSFDEMIQNAVRVRNFNNQPVLAITNGELGIHGTEPSSMEHQE